MAKEINKINLGQYFTPKNIVELMIGLTDIDKEQKVLEPSCGEGIFLEHLKKAGFNNLLGIEVDKDIENGKSFEIIKDSFVTWSGDSNFDLIIGNPPYVRWKNLSEWQKQELRESKYYEVLINSFSDYLAIFIAKSIDLLSVDGELIFITPSYWFQTTHSSKLRDWILERGEFTDIVIFEEDKIFANVNSSLIIFKFIKAKQNKEISFYKFKGSDDLKNLKYDLNDSSQFDSYKKPQFKHKTEWILSKESSQVIANQLEDYCRVESDKLFDIKSFSTLGEFVNIANGMVSGLDEAFKLNQVDLNLLCQAEKDNILQVVKSKDLKSFVSNSYTYYINIPNGLDEESVRLVYPNFIKKLESYRGRLESRYSYGRNLPFWEWAFKRSEKYFSIKEPKIIVPCKERITNKDSIRFSWLQSGCVALQDVTAFSMKNDKRESNEYLLAYMNHPYVTDWIKNKGTIKGGIAEFSEKPLERIPFRRIDWNNKKEVALHKEITRIVRNVTKIKDVSEEVKMELNSLFDDLFLLTKNLLSP